MQLRTPSRMVDNRVLLDGFGMQSPSHAAVPSSIAMLLPSQYSSALHVYCVCVLCVCVVCVCCVCVCARAFEHEMRW